MDVDVNKFPSTFWPNAVAIDYMDLFNLHYNASPFFELFFTRTLLGTWGNAKPNSKK